MKAGSFFFTWKKVRLQRKFLSKEIHWNWKCWMSFWYFQPKFGFSEPQIIVLISSRKFLTCWRTKKNQIRMFRKITGYFYKNAEKNSHFNLLPKNNARVARMFRKSQNLFSLFQICSTWTEKLRRWRCLSPKIDIFWVMHGG